MNETAPRSLAQAAPGNRADFGLPEPRAEKLQSPPECVRTRACNNATSGDRKCASICRTSHPADRYSQHNSLWISTSFQCRPTLRAAALSICTAVPDHSVFSIPCLPADCIFDLFRRVRDRPAMPPSHSLAAADTKTRGARAAHLLDICAQSLRAQACGQSCNAKRVESSLLRQALPPIHCCSESRFFQGPESAWPVQNTSAHSRGSARVTAADASRCVQTDRRSTR